MEPKKFKDTKDYKRIVASGIGLKPKEITPPGNETPRNNLQLVESILGSEYENEVMKVLGEKDSKYILYKKIQDCLRKGPEAASCNNIQQAVTKTKLTATKECWNKTSPRQKYSFGTKTVENVLKKSQQKSKALTYYNTENRYCEEDQECKCDDVPSGRQSTSLRQYRSSQPPATVYPLDENCSCDERFKPGYYDRPVRVEQCDCEEVPKPRKRKPKCPPSEGSVVCRPAAILSNALGPTFDVSLMDNLRMINTFIQGDFAGSDRVTEMTRKEREMCNHISNLQTRIQDLNQQKYELTMSLQEEEKERDLKRRAFLEEQCRLQKLVETSSSAARTAKEEENCIKKMMEEKFEEEERRRGEVVRALNDEEERRRSTLEELSRLATEEQNKLRELQTQYRECECLLQQMKREVTESEAWSIIASKMCHTRVPPQSKMEELERRSRSRNFYTADSKDDRYGQTRSDISLPRSCSGQTRQKKSSVVSFCNEIKENYPDCESDYSRPRDPICGFHYDIPHGEDSTVFNNVDSYTADIDWDPRLVASLNNINSQGLRKSLKSSKSEALAVRRSPRLLKVMWAVTRINVFEDCSRTYEIMDASSKAPDRTPRKTEGIFVVNPPTRRKKR